MDKHRDTHRERLRETTRQIGRQTKKICIDTRKQIYIRAKNFAKYKKTSRQIDKEMEEETGEKGSSWTDTQIDKQR